MSQQKTPESRLGWDEVPSRGTKIRVDSVDPNQGRCLIENCLKFREVEYCHVIPRSFTKFTDNMTNLEWYWGLRHSTLNLDTRRNILLAGSSLHGLHDNHRWGLLPPDDVINKYANNIDEEEHYQRGSVEVPDGVFSYRLIPLHPGMETIGIHRQLGHEPDNLTFTTHVFLFDQLPPLQCHIHPKFAIYEFGSKLVGLAAEMRAELFERWPILDKIALIYRAWDAPPTEDISKWLMDIPDSKGDSSDDDEYPPQGMKRRRGSCIGTAPKRLRGRKGALFPQVQGSPTRRSTRTRSGADSAGKRQHAPL
ncbi:hypothetical protein HGRIS_011172 [Hohenbuehelia grisea]|uniref:HNH nuclease domain-containing protein n=1 Tax=Hohenbuehelia grisea TaxID=104357 RepID=A0ABR3JUD0_9AGAR